MTGQRSATHTLSTFVGGWDDLVALAGRWLWLDMVGTGIHLGDTLPGTRPAQLSHAWGWGEGWWIRVRADVDLPGGLVAARLDLLPAEPALRAAAAGTPVIPTARKVRTWGRNDAEVSAAEQPDMPARLRELHVRLDAPGEGVISAATLVFIDDAVRATESEDPSEGRR